MELQTALDALDAGGNAALLFIAFAFWRLERRIFILEHKFKGIES